MIILPDKIKENIMSKKSFTLFEVILSLFILSITLGVVNRLFVNDHRFEEYKQLLNMENQFIKVNKIDNSENINFK